MMKEDVPRGCQDNCVDSKVGVQLSDSLLLFPSAQRRGPRKSLRNSQAASVDSASQSH